MKVAVYGTLKKGQRLHHFMKEAVYVGDTNISGVLYNLGSYPALAVGTDIIKAEVYDINDETLRWLDRVESNGVIYDRVLIDVEVNGIKQQVFVYKYRNVDYLQKYCSIIQPINGIVNYQGR